MEAFKRVIGRTVRAGWISGLMIGDENSQSDSVSSGICSQHDDFLRRERESGEIAQVTIVVFRGGVRAIY